MISNASANRFTAMVEGALEFALGDGRELNGLFAGPISASGKQQKDNEQDRNPRETNKRWRPT